MLKNIPRPEGKSREGKQMYTEHARIEAQINLKACAQNILNMKENLSPETKMILVVKTNAYGHGAAAIMRELEKVPYVWGYFSLERFCIH